MGAAVCAAGVYGVIWARSVPVPTAKTPTFMVELAPGLDPATFFKEQPSLDILPPPPLAPLTPDSAISAIEPEPTTPAAPKSPAIRKPAASSPTKKPVPDITQKAEPAPERKPEQKEQKKVASIDPRPAPKAPPVEVEQWRVVPTAKASMFNLGGHISNGIVDGMATPHLKEALQKHKNFGKLPPALRAHVISAANIDLNRLAPYRSLLGMEEGLMETQGVRFERVARR
jgi:hypothetical protein